jgi:hypothetical protein
VIRVLATRSADQRFKNVHSLGLGSYIGRTREVLCGVREHATVISPWIDLDGIRFLLECWDERESEDARWDLFVRQVDAPLIRAARGKNWGLYQYQRNPGEGRVPYGMHAKIVLGDDKVATIGSMNLLKASLYSNLEIGVDVREPALARQLSRVAYWLERVSTQCKV